MLLYQLFRPFAYLTIRNSKKFAIDWSVPIICSFICSLVVVLPSDRPQIFMTNGLLGQLLSLIQNLPGFFIAALAVIAAFERAGFDDPLPIPTPTSIIRLGNIRQEIELTRRRMLGLVFGYLAASSLLCYLLITSFNFLAPIIKFYCNQKYYTGLTFLAVFVSLSIMFNIITVTLFGLYQLSDRIYQPD